MTVLNKKKHEIPDDSVYIGRPSKYGNPYSHIEKGTLAEHIVSDRDSAIESYRQWLYSQPKLMSEFRRELAGKTLVCWCKPLPCHGDILYEIANGIPFWEFDDGQ